MNKLALHSKTSYATEKLHWHYVYVLFKNQCAAIDAFQKLACPSQRFPWKACAGKPELVAHINRKFPLKKHLKGFQNQNLHGLENQTRLTLISQGLQSLAPNKNTNPNGFPNRLNFASKLNQNQMSSWTANLSHLKISHDFNQIDSPAENASLCEFSSATLLCWRNHRSFFNLRAYDYGLLKASHALMTAVKNHMPVMYYDQNQNIDLLNAQSIGFSFNDKPNNLSNICKRLPNTSKLHKIKPAFAMQFGFNRTPIKTQTNSGLHLAKILHRFSQTQNKPAYVNLAEQKPSQKKTRQIKKSRLHQNQPDDFVLGHNQNKLDCPEKNSIEEKTSSQLKNSAGYLSSPDFDFMTDLLAKSHQNQPRLAQNLHRISPYAESSPSIMGDGLTAHQLKQVGLRLQQSCGRHNCNKVSLTTASKVAQDFSNRAHHVGFKTNFKPYVMFQGRTIYDAKTESSQQCLTHRIQTATPNDYDFHGACRLFALGGTTRAYKTWRFKAMGLIGTSIALAPKLNQVEKSSRFKRLNLRLSQVHKEKQNLADCKLNPRQDANVDQAFGWLEPIGRLNPIQIPPRNQLGNTKPTNAVDQPSQDFNSHLENIGIYFNLRRFLAMNLKLAQNSVKNHQNLHNQNLVTLPRKTVSGISQIKTKMWPGLGLPKGKQLNYTDLINRCNVQQALRFTKNPYVSQASLVILNSQRVSAQLVEQLKSLRIICVGFHSHGDFKNTQQASSQSRQSGFSASIDGRFTAKTNSGKTSAASAICDLPIVGNIDNVHFSSLISRHWKHVMVGS